MTGEDQDAQVAAEAIDAAEDQEVDSGAEEPAGQPAEGEAQAADDADGAEPESDDQGGEG